MVIFIITISILILAGFSWFVRKLTPMKICPICAGVVGTWLWILGGMFTGLLSPVIYQLPAAILMGGSVVGIAYQFEKKLLTPLIFKLLFIPAGFVAVYSLLLSQWLLFIPEILFLAALSGFYMKPLAKKAESEKNIAASQRGEPRPAAAGREEIKSKIENCC